LDNTPAIILAGGFGTRLNSVIKDVPKPMAPINGKPFLHYIFKSLQAQQVPKAILSVGYLNHVINDYFGPKYLGVEIEYATETEPLGTGGGIRHAFSRVEQDAYVLNGDTFFDIELKRLRTDRDLSIALKKMHHFDRYGTVELDGQQRIIAFHEKKSCNEGWINGGVYYFRKDLFSKIKTEEKFSFEKDVLEQNVGMLYMQGVTFENYFIDIGIPEDYAKASVDLQ
jgi:D-glycero-alpha-D-manno-heptose 1-phosphate guanylyltransferase